MLHGKCLINNIGEGLNNYKANSWTIKVGEKAPVRRSCMSEFLFTKYFDTRTNFRGTKLS